MGALELYHIGEVPCVYRLVTTPLTGVPNNEVVFGWCSYSIREVKIGYTHSVLYR